MSSNTVERAKRMRTADQKVIYLPPNSHWNFQKNLGRVMAQEEQDTWGFSTVIPLRIGRSGGPGDTVISYLGLRPAPAILVQFPNLSREFSFFFSDLFHDYLPRFILLRTALAGRFTARAHVCVRGPHTSSNSPTPAGRPTTQLSSDTLYPGAIGSHRLRAQALETAVPHPPVVPPPNSDASSKSGCRLRFPLTSYRSEAPTTPFLLGFNC